MFLSLLFMHEEVRFSFFVLVLFIQPWYDLLLATTVDFQWLKKQCLNHENTWKGGWIIIF